MYQGSKRREDESEPTQKEAEQMGEPADEDVTEKKTRKMKKTRKRASGLMMPTQRRIINKQGSGN